MDHDQLHKELLRAFVREFFEVFLPEWAARLDFGAVEWLPQELFANPPDGPLHRCDLVARVASRPGPDGEPRPPLLVALLLEIEAADRTTDLEPRLPHYYLALRNLHGLPVLPVALYLNLALEGIGPREWIERCGDFETLRFRYLAVPLGGLDAVQYVRRGPLAAALAAHMRVPEALAPDLALDAAAMIVAAHLPEPLEMQLLNCLEAYWPLPEGQESPLESRPLRKEFAMIRQARQTTYEKGIEKGIERGIERGIEKGLARGLERGERASAAAIVVRMLEARFGALSLGQRQRLDALTAAELQELPVRIMNAGSLAELGLS